MSLLEIAGAIAVLVGIVAGIVQVLDYLEKQREKKRVKSAPKELQQITGSQPQTLPSDKHQDWGEAVDVSVFYGRQDELAELERWIITDHCRLIAILGMGGIGKTALSMKLAGEIKDDFEYLYRRDLKNAPLIEDILGDCIKFLSNQKKTDLPEDLHGRISLVIKYLQRHHCLLILDNAETILKSGERAGHYREGYEGYGELLQRVGEGIHQSCLLLTSREKPKEVALLEGKTLPVRSFPLRGLNKEAGGKILAAKGLAGSAEEYGALTDRYQGNPLALKIIPTTIQDVFAGDIAKFLEQGTAVFGDIRDVLDQQFERLSNLEKEIMYWLAIDREPVSLQELKDDFAVPVPQPKLIEALESLGRRSLIEKSAATFTQQPVVMEYVTDHLTEQVYEELATEKIALFNSHALIKATAKEYVRNSQVQFILKPIADRLLTFLGQKGAECKLKEIISTLREKSHRMPGYTGGNLINLLVQLQSDLSNHDFSDLMIWQAYLQGVDLQDANLAYSDLTRSMFTETLGLVNSLAFSPDGKLLAIGSSNGEVRLLQISDGKPVFTFIGHTRWIESFAFSHDGKIIVSAGNDQTVRFWNIGNGQCLKIFESPFSPIWSVFFDHDGSTWGICINKEIIRLWDLRTGQCQKTLHGHTDSIYCVAPSPRGNIVASCGKDCTLRLWDFKSGKCLKIIRGHSKTINSIAFNSNGDIIASGSGDCTVKLWNVETGNCIKTFRCPDSIIEIIFNPKNDLVASCGHDQTIRVWYVSTGQCLKILEGHTSWVWAVAFYPDSSVLASGSNDQTIRLWNVNTEQCIKILYGHNNTVRSLSLSPSGDCVWHWLLDTVHCKIRGGNFRDRL